MSATDMQKSYFIKNGVSLETKLLHLTVWYWSKKRHELSDSQHNMRFSQRKRPCSDIARTTMPNSSHTNNSCTGQNNLTKTALLALPAIWIHLPTIVHITSLNTNHSIWTFCQTATYRKQRVQYLCCCLQAGGGKWMSLWCWVQWGWMDAALPSNQTTNQINGRQFNRENMIYVHKSLDVFN